MGHPFDLGRRRFCFAVVAGMTKLEREAVFFGVELFSIDSGNLFQVVDGFEIAILLAVLDDCIGFRRGKSEPAGELRGGRLIHIDVGDGRKILYQVVEDCGEFIIGGDCSESRHLADGVFPACAVLAIDDYVIRGMAFAADANERVFSGA